MFYVDLKIFKHFSSDGYSLSPFLKYILNIALLYGCSLVDPLITKSASFTKEYDNYNSIFEAFNEGWLIHYTSPKHSDIGNRNV